ncbi:hypothetical protein Daus18300_014537 [Diaporthe australafricana]|uniref:SNF2 N-terminal domain-containing protein n=1 Tax=Diaporthe australafricana TaxID=127596 RepID=A0ABR3VUR7_9PEZI
MVYQTFAGILADNMGPGKTFETLSAMWFIMEHCGASDHRPLVIVSPITPVLRNWEDEIHRFFPGFTPMVLANICQDVLLPGTRFVNANESSKAWPKSLSYVWKPHRAKAGRVVILTTLDTYSRRTVKTALAFLRLDADDYTQQDAVIVCGHLTDALNRRLKVENLTQAIRRAGTGLPKAACNLLFNASSAQYFPNGAVQAKLPSVKDYRYR